MDGDWIKARIKPQEVRARIVTQPNGEVISRAGTFYRVKQGHYIIEASDGNLWQCSPEGFREAYEVTP